MEKHDPLLAELFTTDLVGGTLVEYLDGAGFDFEFGRGTITCARIDRAGMCIITNGEAKLEYDDGLRQWKLDKRDGVYYMSNPNLYCYALAPRNVNIPEKSSRMN